MSVDHTTHATDDDDTDDDKDDDMSRRTDTGWPTHKGKARRRQAQTINAERRARRLAARTT